MNNANKRRQRKIESHLKNYHQYKIGIKNLKLQLDSIMPNITVSFDVLEGSVGTFVIKSPTEKYAIDRIESKRALDLYEQMEQYQLIVDCIDSAIEGLEEEEQKFVEYRYFSNFSARKMAMMLGYGESTIFHIRNKILDKLAHSLRAICDI
ncbi:sigma-70 family RNA polymerase sigma factor [Bacillus sp. MMSF_3328]|uniref:sigma-70 family RNA polymerase sigma factor n=1 Tax=Bacillus sp. MMSF_3328 TaxID=3047080 RepID=UPI00273FEAE7|nr:sigma-70 family RNA polymerase sigma factor [Bacillus sp. MMSF_3328]